MGREVVGAAPARSRAISPPDLARLCPPMRASQQAMSALRRHQDADGIAARLVATWLGVPPGSCCAWVPAAPIAAPAPPARRTYNRSCVRCRRPGRSFGCCAWDLAEGPARPSASSDSHPLCGPSPRCREPRVGTLADELPFGLRARGEAMEDQPASCAGGIDVLPQAPEVDLPASRACTVRTGWGR